MLSLEVYRDYLGLSPGNEDELQALKEEVEDLWVSTTQRAWKAESGRVEIQRVHGDRITTLFLQLIPVATVTKVEVKGESNEDWEELLFADGTWELIGDQLVRYGSWWKPLVRVTYNGGYATDACPAKIRRALKLQAKFARERQDTEVKISSQNFKGGAGNFVEPDLHPYFAKLAQAERRLVF